MSDWVSTFPGYKQVLTTAKKVFGNIIRTGPTPRNVGIIMDGNRRYAKSQKIELKEGHNMGFESMANILEVLYESGVQCATVYAFSIENFNRLSYEVKWLMDLAKLKMQQISQHGDLCEQYGIKIKILGNTKLLPLDVQEILFKTEEMTKNNTRAVLNVCFPYTSRDEITNAIKCVVSNAVEEGGDYAIDEDTINQFLYTADSPPLDLLVRTSGTYRLSDFLLWQCVSPDCSIVFVDKLWPEFKPWDMCKLLINWSYNKYWYGHGNGVNTTNIFPQEADKVESFIVRNKPSGFERYEDNDNDEISENSSDLGGADEMDTNTSEEESESIK